MSSAPDPTRDRSRGRLRVAVIVDAIENEYQWGLVTGALTAIQDTGALLFVVAGGLVEPPDSPDRGDNAIYDLVTADSVDGVILFSGAIGHAVGPTGLAEWARRFSPLPVASIGVGLPELPSFVVENESGTFRATTHLACDHGHRQIAFVEGAPGSSEAEARRRGYERGLAEAGLALDPRLIAPGDFTVLGGHAAVAHLLDRERINVSLLDAIVAANDAMAFGVIEELARRNIEVPKRVAVIGFDDVMLARVGPPPLTTVRQPVDRLATAALRNVIGAIRGTKTPGAVLETQLVVRRSCGCLTKATRSAESGGGLRSTSEVALLARRDQITASLARAARGTLVGAGAGWEQRMLLALVDDARSGGGHLVEVMDGILVRLARAGTDPAILDEILTDLRAETSAALECSAASRNAEDAFHDARRFLHDQLLRLRMRERAELTFGMQTLTHLARQLRAPRDPATATTGFIEHTRALGCDAGLVAWLNDDGTSARPVLHYDRAGLRQPLRFPAKTLWPGADPDSRTNALVIHPILDRHHLLGFTAFSLGAVDGSLHELLRELVSDRLRHRPSLLSIPAATEPEPGVEDAR
ncbi:MAG: substrate-binding domain-containing protein [Polyangiaceae bacterium]|nr:substrate-binding domain-containing protein [Polyangiaceae bacterium]